MHYNLFLDINIDYVFIYLFIFIIKIMIDYIKEKDLFVGVQTKYTIRSKKI